MPLVTTDSPQKGVTHITLNRPDKRNALSSALMQELVAAVQDAQNARVIVIRGEGPCFCAGLDLQETLNPDDAHTSADLVRQMLDVIYHSPGVTIAAVHGAALAGGAGLMSACDLAVAAEGTKIGYPETRRGMIAGIVMSFLRRQVREREARELLLCADSIDAQRALEMGLVNRVVPADQLDATVQEFVSSVLQCAPNATAKTKKYLDSLWTPSLKEDLQRALDAHVEMRKSPEAAEGIRAFLEKRTPEWCE
jgi:methylglutaconyl-CoA hydratase